VGGTSDALGQPVCRAEIIDDGQRANWKHVIHRKLRSSKKKPPDGGSG